jgi:hypothetical protein
MTKICEVCGKKIVKASEKNKVFDEQLVEWVYVHEKHCYDVWYEIKAMQDGIETE